MSVQTAVMDTEDRLEGFRVLLFGSALYKNRPADADLLFIYDSGVVSPSQAYSRIQMTIDQVSVSTGLSVHPVVLSLAEEGRVQFEASLDPYPLLLLDKISHNNNPTM